LKQYSTNNLLHFNTDTDDGFTVFDDGSGYADGTSTDGTGLVFLPNSAEGKIAKHTLIDIFNLFKKLLLTLTTNRLKLDELNNNLGLSSTNNNVSLQAVACANNLNINRDTVKSILEKEFKGTIIKTKVGISKKDNQTLLFTLPAVSRPAVWNGKVSKSIPYEGEGYPSSDGLPVS